MAINICIPDKDILIFTGKRRNFISFPLGKRSTSDIIYSMQNDVVCFKTVTDVTFKKRRLNKFSEKFKVKMFFQNAM